MTPFQYRFQPIKNNLGISLSLVRFYLLRSRVLLLLIFLIGFISSCSSTSNLPEGQMLYTGVKSIDYGNNTKNKKKGNDSTGVITSIAHAVKAVDELISAKNLKGIENLADMSSSQNPKTKEEKQALKEAQKIEAQAMSDARTEVDAVLGYPPNYALFGSSSYRSFFKPGLWFYNGFVHSQSSIGKWIFKHFSSTPIFISTVNPQLRAQVATNTLHNYGYFRGTIDYEVIPASNKRKAKVSYSVHPHGLYRLDSICYTGFPSVGDSLIRSHWNERLLKSGDPFQVVKLSDEQKRLESLFRDHGYYYYNSNYTTFRADTVSKPQKVQLQILPVAGIPERVKHRWYIGKTLVTMLNAKSDSTDNEFTLRDHTFKFKGKKTPVRPGIWLRSIVQRRGNVYNQSLAKQSLEKISEMGIFSQISVSYTPRDTSQTCDTLDINVLTRLDKPYTAELEMNVTSKSNDQKGPGIALSLSKKNAFRRGESLSLRLYGSYEWQTKTANRRNDNDLLNSYELGASLDLKFPRFVLPFFNNRFFRLPATTTFSLSGDWNERANYFNLITFGGSITYKWNTNQRSKHELTPFNLDYTQLVHTTTTFDSIMKVNPALYVSMRDQFIPSISYTYTYTSSSDKRNPIWWQTSIKEAGNITSGIFALSGKQFNQKNKKLFGTPFAQFLKLTSEVHKSFKLTESLTLATRLMGGIVYSFGNSNSAPYKEQFYIGGANSVRAFTVRTMGPGRFHTQKSKYSYMDQTGDIKMEANAELRFPIWGSLNGAAFLDMGNVWLLRNDNTRPGGKIDSNGFLKSLAVGTGAGLRYDMEFIVLRLDLGVALHTPYETNKKGFYNIKNFKDGLALHFAVGYPF